MSELIEKLVRMKTPSQSKSYFIGVERGKIWAEDEGDYLEIRKWIDFGGSDYLNISLPDNEETHYHVMKAETDIEWEHFVRGWIDGVKETGRK
jgi:hypothetical protein